MVNCLVCNEVEAQFCCSRCRENGISWARFCSEKCYKKCCAKMHRKYHKLGGELKLPTKNFRPKRMLKLHQKGHGTVSDSHVHSHVHVVPFPITSIPRLPIPAETPCPLYAYHIAGRDRIEESVETNNQVLKVNETVAQSLLREACKIARGALEAGKNVIQVTGVTQRVTHGVTQRVTMTPQDVDLAVHNYIVSHGAYPSPLNYKGFPSSCCVSVNNVMCHGIPDSRPLLGGDIVSIDVTAFYRGFHGDCCDTIIVPSDGDADAKAKVADADADADGDVADIAISSIGANVVLLATKEALLAGLSVCKPGALFRDIGVAIENLVEAKYPTLEISREFCGHGVGRIFHGPPCVLHWKPTQDEKDEEDEEDDEDQLQMTEMQVGHVFTIEPILVQKGSWETVIWDDGWSASAESKTKSKKHPYLSAQFESTLIITETGYEVLT